MVLQFFKICKYIAQPQNKNTAMEFSSQKYNYKKGDCPIEVIKIKIYCIKYMFYNYTLEFKSD